MSIVKILFVNFTIIGIIKYYFYCKIKNLENIINYNINQLTNNINQLTNNNNELTNNINQLTNDINQLINNINQLTNDINKLSNNNNESNDIKIVYENINYENESQKKTHNLWPF